MEEKDIISIEAEGDSHVLVERNKRRERQRVFLYFKRGLALLLLVGICFGAYKLFPHAKTLWNKMPWVNGGEQPSTNTDTGTPPASSNTGNTSTNENTDTENGGELGGEYKINTVKPYEYKAINESGCDFDFSQKYSAKSLEEIYRQYGNEAPVVLITHSAIRESYSNGTSYSPSDNFYSDNENVCEIGKIICQSLNSYGVNAIQLSELYASGSIYGSSTEYEKSLSDTLKKYPSITYIFNVSRGIKINDDLTMDKSVITSGENSLAQISLISGTSSNEASESQVNNVLFAFDFATFANQKQQNIIKENKISRFDLSQGFGPVSVNIDVGEYSNSFEEASSSAEVFTEIFSEYLKEG